MILHSFSMIRHGLADAIDGVSQPARIQKRFANDSSLYGRQITALCGVKRTLQRLAMTRPIPRQPAIQAVGERLFIAIVVGHRSAGCHTRRPQLFLEIA